MNPGAPEVGLTASLRRLGDTLLEVAQVRLALLSNEVESEKLRVFDGLVWAVAALLFVSTGLMLTAGFFVLLMPPDLRTATLGVLALVYVVAGVLLAMQARRRLTNPAGPIAATVDELRRDRAELTADD